MAAIDVISWNLFHGRDWPPNEALLTLRSRLLGVSERDDTHVQVNHPLRREFATVLGQLDWSLALLQEAPPTWLRPLCRELGVSGVSALTARNLGAAPRAALARLNPDLIASGEGGSNQLLVRAPWRIAEVRRLTLTHRPERRRMLFARVENPDGRAIGVANLHATAHDEAAAARDVERAAERASAWAEEAPLIFGGDFNLRPASAPQAFERLRARYGLNGPTGPKAIDHLLVKGISAQTAPERLPAAAREVEIEDGLRIRLSDHAPLAASLRLG